MDHSRLASDDNHVVSRYVLLSWFYLGVTHHRGQIAPVVLCRLKHKKKRLPRRTVFNYLLLIFSITDSGMSTTVTTDTLLGSSVEHTVTLTGKS